MKQHYKDITDKLGAPRWWDEAGCPRYETFNPGMANDIYAQEVALVRIQCQACGAPYDVCMSWGAIGMTKRGRLVPSLEAMVLDKSLHYGDPPNYGCCLAGANMNCDDIKVIEFWERVTCEWKRHPELEVDLQDASCTRTPE